MGAAGVDAARRFPARVDSEGTLFLLREQDRSGWIQSMIVRGCALDRASSGDRITAFHLEASIAACHAAAASWESTDWAQIVELYDGSSPSPGRRSSR
jgi:RNA polymerase sigma-70 factor (ECF subfamily)